MRAEIISIGTEILLGEIQDTNARYLAVRLPALGTDLYFMHQVGDNRTRLADLIRTAYGPRRSHPLHRRPRPHRGRHHPRRHRRRDGRGASTSSRNWSRRCGRSSPDAPAACPRGTSSRPLLIPSAQSLPNPRGTAPGWWVERDAKIIVAMPGPPAEMTGMWERDVRPRLAERSHDAVIISRTLKTVGISEGRVDEQVSHLLQSANPSVGVYAKPDGIHLRLTAKCPTAEDAYRVIRPAEEEIRAIFGPALWGTDDETLAEATGGLLKERGLTVAVMESCTGGLLASSLTDVPGSSDYFKGGLVTYTAEAKQRYGVPGDVLLANGLVSEETARAMAAAVRKELSADIGVGITGVAGPEPHDGQPVGRVHVALEAPGGSAHSTYRFAQTRPAIKARAVTTALQLLRRAALAQFD